jgi:hypothetical protein
MTFRKVQGNGGRFQIGVSKQQLFDEASSFLDLNTGRGRDRIEGSSGRGNESGGEEPDFPPWQGQEWEIAKRIVSTDRFQQLLTKFDVHEWAIMQDFSHSASDRLARIC